MTRIEASEVTREDLETVHPAGFIDRIESLEPAFGLARVDPDTYMSPGSHRAAKLAAGACIEATRRVIAGEAKRAFCAVRPPGHHAELAEAMGFCLFNNIAAAAMTALAEPGVERIAILDFDVHHCNGTVDIFKDDERVLVCSSFQDHFYPHRYLDFENEHVVRSPLAAGTGTKEFRAAIERDWLAAVEAHKPQIVFVSAGFDAHGEDPVGQLELTDDDFRWVTGVITSVANDYAEGRIVSTLEGGYDLSALASSVEAHVAALGPSSGR
ncbi:MAG: histone deacetylase family protein [Gammaproteobacteria bacterium]|nr:histone deacetylase family protein [Gammaproteobacteria bacterium]